MKFFYLKPDTPQSQTLLFHQRSDMVYFLNRIWSKATRIFICPLGGFEKISKLMLPMPQG